MRGKRLILVALVLLAAAAVLGYLRLRTRSGEEPATVRVSGNIEVTDVELSFKIPGRVIERRVSEGEAVKQGQVVAQLEQADLALEVELRRAEADGAAALLAELEAGSRAEEIARAEAAAGQAKARLAELEAGSRPQEIAAAEAALELARAELAQRKRDLERAERLLREGSVTTQSCEQARTAHEVAGARAAAAEEELKLVKEGPRQEQIEQARAQLRQAEESLALLRAGPRRETIEQARAKLEAARRALALAETRLGYAAIRSPVAGIVLSQDTEPGEYVAPGTPVVTVADLGSVFLRAYINETDLGRVKLGQPVTVRTDTYPGKTYEGRITFISSEAEFTPKNVQTQKERVKLVYRVKIELPNPRMELKPGMPADAEIRVGEAAR